MNLLESSNFRLETKTDFELKTERIKYKETMKEIISNNLSRGKRGKREKERKRVRKNESLITKSIAKATNKLQR